MYTETHTHELFTVGADNYLATVTTEEDGDYYYQFISEIRREEVFNNGKHGVKFVEFDGNHYGFYNDNICQQSCNIPCSGDAYEAWTQWDEEERRITEFYANRESRIDTLEDGEEYV